MSMPTQDMDMDTGMNTVMNTVEVMVMDTATEMNRDRDTHQWISSEFKRTEANITVFRFALFQNEYFEAN
jgi:hypothetical protein